MTDVYRFYFNAVEARRNAEMALRSKLPGWRIYHRSALRRAIRNWRQYAEAMRAMQ